MTLEEAEIMAIILGIHPPVWPSGKVTFPVAGQAIGFWADHFRHVLHDNGKRYPMAPPPAGHVRWMDLDKKQLDQLNIPGILFSHDRWAINPLDLSPLLQLHLGLISPAQYEEKGL
jgi:hypothetical protein